MKKTILTVLVVGAMTLAGRPAMADTWTLGTDLTAQGTLNASGGNFTLTFTITNNSGTDAGIYDFSLQLTGGNGTIVTTSKGGTGSAIAGFEEFDDTKQNNGSGNTCNTTSNSGWLCVDFSGGFATIPSGGSLTWTFAGTYGDGTPVSVLDLMAQGCFDTSDTFDAQQGPGEDIQNCPFNGDNTFNISAPGTPDNNQVPEPGSLMLFGTGLLGMAGFVRRKLMS